MSRTIIVLARAVQDLEDHVVAFSRNNPSSADRFRAATDSTLAQLASMPGVGE